MINLNDLSPEELRLELESFGEPGYRAGQIFRWFARGVQDFSEMSDLSKALRDRLADGYGISRVIIERKLVSEADGTAKYLMRLNDGNLIESVAMRYHHGLSLCLSTQAGCAMGCRFCASALNGKARNLTSGEILGQASVIQRELGERISNIVLMGVGEPLDNLDNTALFLKNINDPRGMNIGFRHISLSTCGIADKIYELAGLGMPVTLSVSLHAPNDEIRERIMPVNRKYPIAKLIEACRYYIKTTNRRISFEYILIEGLNDSASCADELAGLLRGMLCHVNLIPANLVPESGFRASGAARVSEFEGRLARRGVNVTVRRTLGPDIEASCGQLRLKHGRNTEE